MNSKASNIRLALPILVLAALFLVHAPASAEEGPIIRSGKTVGVEATQVLEGDFYGVGEKVTLSGEAREDVYALGGSVTINAPVQNDLVIVGGAVQVHGAVHDDVRILGGEVTIAEPVSGDVLVLGGSVQILSTASIAGDLIFLGSEITVDGAVAGTVYGTADTLRINARVGEDVRVRAIHSLSLGDAAEIEGDIAYSSNNELVRSQNASVAGNITHEQIKEPPVRADMLLFPILVLLFSSLTIFFLARTRTFVFAEKIRTGYGQLGLIGLGMLFALPLASIILMASVIGIFVGIALLCAYILLIMISIMYLPIIIGTFLSRLMRLGEGVTLYSVLIGVVATFLLPFIPLIGGFVLFLTFVLVFGTLCHTVYTFFRGL